MSTGTRSTWEQRNLRAGTTFGVTGVFNLSRKSWIVSAVSALLGLAVGVTGTALVFLGPAGNHRGASALKVAAALGSPSPIPSPSAARGTPSQAPLNPVPSPAPTIPAAGAPTEVNGMAFDTATGQLIAFGTDPSSPSAWPAPDTWVWNGTHWNQAVVTGRTPPARTGASMAYDPIRQLIVLHGGYDQQTNWANDTWTWNGSQWSQQSPGQSPPADGYVRAQPMCWDAPLSRVVMVNEQGNAAQSADPSQTWGYNGTDWARLMDSYEPSLGTRGAQPIAMTCDNAHNSVLLFSQVNGVPTTWTYDNATHWTQVATSGTTSANFVMASDDANLTVVMFGSNGDTWTWDGSKWTVQNPQHSPPARAGAAMAFDPVHGVVVMLGGSVPGSATQLHDTWTWNGSDWTQAG